MVDYLGESVEEIGFAAVHPDDREAYLKKWLNCLATGEPCEQTYRLRRVDGEYRWSLYGLRLCVTRLAVWRVGMRFTSTSTTAKRSRKNYGTRSRGCHVHRKLRL